MGIQEFIIHLAEQFDNVSADKISAETKFRDIEGYSSLIALYIISMIDEEYKVRFRGDDMRNSQTVQDLFNLVKSRL